MNIITYNFYPDQHCPICKSQLNFVNLFEPREERYHCKYCHYTIYRGYGRFEIMLDHWKKTFELTKQGRGGKCGYVHKRFLSNKNDKRIFKEFGNKIKEEIIKLELKNIDK